MLVAIPKDIIDVSTMGEDGTWSINGGNSVISWAEMSVLLMTRGLGESVSLMVMRIGRSPSKCLVLIERRAYVNVDERPYFWRYERSRVTLRGRELKKLQDEGP